MRGLSTPTPELATSATLRRVVVLAALVTACLVVGAGSAAGEVRRTTVTDEFGPDGTSATSFPGTVAQLDFNEASSQLLVMTEEPREVFTFDVTGPGDFAPVPGGHFPVEGSETAGMAVSPLTGDVYVASRSGGLFGYTATGTSLPNFPITGFPLTGIYPTKGVVCGVSINSEGDLVVGERTHGRVEILDPEGNPLRAIDGGGLGWEPCRVQVDRANDDIYFSGTEYGLIRLIYREDYDRFGAQYLGGEGITDLAVDPVTRHVLAAANPYYSETHELKEYLREGGEGTAVNRVFFGSPVAGIAAAPNGTAYLGVGGKVAEIPLAAVPEVETLPPLGASEPSATVDPHGNGAITDCYFQWGESSEYTLNTNKTPCDQATPFSNAETVSADLPGLTPGQTYHYRVVAGNANYGGFAYGHDETITPPLVSDLKTEAAGAITRNSATLNASFTGDGSGATYYFEWGPSPFFLANKTPEPAGDAGSPSGHTPLSVPINNLLPQTTYYFRVVATDGAGTSEGLVKSFTTQSFVLDTTTKPITSLSQNGVTLNGEFTGDGEPVQYFFEWGPTNAYGNSVPPDPADAGSPNGPTQVSEDLTDFEGSGTYHYRLVATSPLGTSYGEDETFTALPAPVPSISGTNVSSVGKGATLEAEITPNRKATVYLFEYGPTAEYGSSTPQGGPIPGVPNGPQAVHLDVDGLTPGTVYHYRALATNFAGTTYGPDETFVTPGAPVIDLASASGVQSTSTTLSAAVTPNLRSTTVHFEYGPTQAYGFSTPESGSIGSDDAAHSVDAIVANLAPATTYHFRAVATNDLGTTRGADQTFTTVGAPSSQSPPVTTHKCKRRFVKRKGRCVKQRRAHHHHKRIHRKG